MKELLTFIGAILWSVFGMAVLLGIVHLWSVTNMSEWLCAVLMVAWGSFMSGVLVYIENRI